ncbi:MAG: hypothetical protein ABIK90_05525 [candidate division WOR-3 bacterium]
MYEVKIYSGYKGEERPRAILLDGKEYLIEKILYKEIVEDFKTRERKIIFLCFCNQKYYKIIRLPNNNWECYEQK